MRCPICSGENNNNAAFCTFCGTALQDSTSGFMDGIDTSNLDLNSQLNNGFGKRNTAEQAAQQPTPPVQPQPTYQQPQQTYQQHAYQQRPAGNMNDPYATNNFGGAQANSRYGQQNYQQSYAQNNFNQQGYAQQPYQATGFQQNNAAFNDPANGFANPSYNGFGMGRAGGAAVRKKSYTGVLIAIIALICVIAFFVFMALKYSKKNSADKLFEMKCISVKMSSAMEKNDDFNEDSFIGRYDSSVMDVVTEFYEQGDDAAFVYMKLSYPTLTAEDLSGTDANTFLNMWIQQMRMKDSSFKNLSTSEDESDAKASLITLYEAKRVYIFAACRQEDNAFYFSMFMCNEDDRSDYESKFRKWDKTIKITD